MDYISHRHPEIWIQAGIGGAFDQALEIGKVYQVTEEMMVGFGAENAEGRIMDQFELGWADPNAFPFIDGKLICSYRPHQDIPTVSGMTTFYAHGNQDQIDQLRKSNHGQMENMEGAPFFYISLIRKIPFLSFRSVSNYVVRRDKASWQIKEAIKTLNDHLIHQLEQSAYKTDHLFHLP
jgi:futalosine hydrolase